jgi:hypothetical protein
MSRLRALVGARNSARTSPASNAQRSTLTQSAERMTEDREQLLDEIARCFMRAALDQMLADHQQPMEAARPMEASDRDAHAATTPTA